MEDENRLYNEVVIKKVKAKTRHNFNTLESNERKQNRHDRH